MRTRHSLLSFATQVAFAIVTMAMALVASPWIETWLGKDRFGAFRVLIDCQGFLVLLELGLGGAVAPLLARALGRGDEAELRKTMVAGVRAYAWVSLVTLAFGGCLTLVIPRLALDLPPADVDDLRRAWALILLSFLALGLVPFRAIVEARQRGYQVNLLLIGQAVIVTMLSLLLARAGWGITGQALAALVGTTLFALTLAAGVSWSLPGLLRALWTMPADAETRRSLRALSLPTFLMTLSGRVSLMTDNLVIGGLMGAATVTALYFTQRLAVMAQMLLQGIGTATWAALAELHARGERETFNRRLVELTRLIAVLSAAGLGPIVAYNRHFFTRWAGPDVSYGGDVVIAVAALNAYLMALQSFWGWCFSATGEVRRITAAALAASVLNLAASLALTRALGMVGPLLGTTIGLVAVSGWYLPRALRRVFGTPVRPLVTAAVWPLACGLIYASGLCWVARHHTPRGWPGLAVEMSLAALGFLALAYAVLLTPDDRALWRFRLQMLRPRSSWLEPAIHAPDGGGGEMTDD